MSPRGASEAPSSNGDDTPDAAIARLARSERPFLIGVRHHSPAVAASIGRMLDAFRPTRVLIELPVELDRWLPWLAHEDARAPLALAASIEGSPDSLAFYPFADFSPELAAARWAREKSVAVEAFDLPVAARVPRALARPRDGDDAPSVIDAVARREGADGFEELWDRLVEARAEGQSPEAIRRAALLIGWALRRDTPIVDPLDRAREAHMRARVDAALGEEGARVAAVIGSFHASALADEPLLGAVDRWEPSKSAARPVTTALLPYSFPLLDSRSGYPAGIRDPAWQQRAFEGLRASRSLAEEAAASVTEIARHVRSHRHVASFPDAREAARIALDLARVRGLSSPSRREIIEGITTAMGQGEAVGRGRVLARALAKVMIGEQRGSLARGTPRSGLALHVDALLGDLGFPDATEKEARELNLDPLRSGLDRRREIALERLDVAAITYGARVVPGATNMPGNMSRAVVETAGTVGSRWSLRFTPTTSATIELAGLFGVTLRDAARGRILERRARSLEADERRSAVELVALTDAARAGVGDLVEATLDRLREGALAAAPFADLVRFADVIGRIDGGHFAALPRRAEDESPDAPLCRADVGHARSVLTELLVAALEGLAGSTDVADAIAARDLLDLPARAGLGEARLSHAFEQLAREGSPLMQGAGTALRWFTEHLRPDELGAWTRSLVEDNGLGVARASRLRGLVAVGMPALEAELAFTEPFVRAIASLDDAALLSRAPSLRDGFEVLSPRARDRLLAVLIGLVAADDAGADAAILDFDPATLAAYAEADGAARAELERLGLLSGLHAATSTKAESAASASQPRGEGDADSASAERAASFVARGAISTRDRLRLILGRERDGLPPTAREAAIALDRLYGRGEGEGSADPGPGGVGSANPSIRVWAEELEALFGEEVREEVLARAAQRGQVGAALEIDPGSVTPSVELLEQILALRGGLAEADVQKLRALVSRVIASLVEALATRVRPALAGLVSPRTTRRRGGPVDLGRTIATNLKTARKNDDGVTLSPERLVFRERQKRALDWHVILLVDVSGSMTPSVIYSALMSAILSGMPALTVRFVAFNDRVVDLSDHASDPLALLLEIAIGGGTLIGNALRYARSLVRVPQRTLVVLLSDFEDGGPLGLLLDETRALVESGVRPLGLAALDDRGAPRYQAGIASTLVAAGMPIAALTPLELARWIGEQVR